MFRRKCAGHTQFLRMLTVFSRTIAAPMHRAHCPGTVSVVSNEWLGIEDVCGRVGLCRTSLYDMWARGVGPRFSQVGRRRLVRAEWLEDWLLACEVAS